MNVILRRAEAADAEALWAWANDPAARAASGTQAPIEWPHHVSWLAKRLASPNNLILMAESPAGQPLGTIRFETDDHWVSARLSYLVAPDSRGRGVGRTLLERGPDALAAVRTGVRLVAQVRPTNQPSRRLFEALGWVEDGSTAEFLRFVGLARGRP